MSAIVMWEFDTAIHNQHLSKCHTKMFIFISIDDLDTFQTFLNNISRKLLKWNWLTRSSNWCQYEVVVSGGNGPGNIFYFSDALLVGVIVKRQ
jgi:hypothetical protein